jgi:hypothetical protein
MIREIDSPDWPAFCERITGQLAGAMATVEITGRDGVKAASGAGAAFESIVFEKTGGCSDVIKLRFKSAREIVHEIVEPIRIMLHPSKGSGDYNPLQIEAESGLVSLTFHPAIHAQMLEGLRPG